jgi:hypothetical protein
MTTGVAAGVDVVITAIDKISAPIRKINQKLAAMAVPARKLNAALAQLGTELRMDRLAESVGNVGVKLADVAHGATQSAKRISYLATAGVGAIGGLFALAVTTAKTGEAALVTAQKIGLSVQAFQRLNYAAGISNVETEAFSAGMRALSRNMAEAAKGGKEAAQGFIFAGIRIKDAAGKLKGGDQVLLDIADRFAAMPDGVTKTALAMKLFGKSGADLIPLLNLGSRGVRQLMQEADRLGVVMTDAQAAMADDFADNVDRLKIGFLALKDVIGVAVMPAFNDLVVSLREWIVANRALVATRVQEFAVSFGNAVRALLDPTSEARRQIAAVWEQITRAGDAFARASQIVGGPLNAAMLLIAAWTLAPLVTSAVALTSAFVSLLPAVVAVASRLAIMAWPAIAAGVMAVVGAVGSFTTALLAGYGPLAAFNLMLAANPIGAVLIGLTALAGAALLIYKNWGPIKEWFIGLWGAIVEDFHRRVEVIKKLIGLVADGVKWVLSLGTGKAIAAPPVPASPTPRQAAPIAPVALPPPSAPRTPLAAPAPVVSRLFQGAVPLSLPGQAAAPAAAPPAQVVSTTAAPAQVVAGQKTTIAPVNVSAPITITVPAGVDHVALAREVERAVQRAIDRAEQDRRSALHD